MPRIWLDLSLISLHDRATGIQRVVRNLSSRLLADPPRGWEVVALASRDGARYVEISVRASADGLAIGSSVGPARPGAGDIFLGLDLAPRIVSARHWQLMAWRRAGVALHFMVYDLLPAHHPEWFNSRSSRWFSGWLRSLAVAADNLICISGTARNGVDAWMRQTLGEHADRPKSTVIALGADLDSASDPATGQDLALSAQAGKDGFVLMVGTLEPRKSIAEVLDVFETLWSGGERCALVLAGRAGWKVDDLLLRLARHPESGRRLMWVDGPSDAELAFLYRRCRGLVMASRGEGFGLPVIEALQHGRPVLARDIPVLREVASGPGASFFADGSPAELAAALRLWLDGPAGKNSPAVVRTGGATWAESARQLVRALGLPQ